MLKRMLFFFGTVFAFYQDSEANKISVDPQDHPVSVIIDTDCDVDDMMAILYLLNSPLIDVKAITTVGDGLTRWEYGAKNILNLLELAEHPRIPVSYGARKSISPMGQFPIGWRKESDEVRGIKLPENSHHASHKRSPDLMIDIIMNSSVKITLLCIAPLTNLALALRKTPEIKDHIEQVYFMGGALLVPGNIQGRPQGFRNRVAEYNVFIDAQAAEEVFQSGIPITLIPLDTTQFVPMTEEFFNKVSEQRQTPMANFAYEILKGGKHEFFWDPLAASLITHPEIATYRNLNLTINLKRGTEYGRVIMTKNGSPVKVTTSVDAEKFYEIFLSTLNRPMHLQSGHTKR